MRMKIKTSVILVALAGILLFFMLNYWMSCEISKPAVSQSTVTSNLSENTVVKSPALNAPAMPVQAEIQEPAETPMAAQKEQKAERTGPVYDPPSQDVILVQ